MIHQEAMEWLDKQTGDKPFYGLFTYTLPHAELYQPNDSILQAYVGRFCNDKTFGGTDRYHATVNTHAQFAAMITRLDAYGGRNSGQTQRKKVWTRIRWLSSHRTTAPTRKVVPTLISSAAMASCRVKSVRVTKAVSACPLLCAGRVKYLPEQSTIISLLSTM